MSESVGRSLERDRVKRVLGLTIAGHIVLAAWGPLNEHIPLYLTLTTLLFVGYFRIMAIGDGFPRWSMILCAALAMRLAHLFDLPSLSDDLYRYLVEGRMVREGVNPYIVSPTVFLSSFPGDRFVPWVNHPEYPAIYPPLAQYFFAAVGKLSYSVWALKSALIACDMAVGIVLGRWLADTGRPRALAGWYLLNPLVIIETASSGHFEPLGALFVVLSAYVFQRGHKRIATVGVASAIAVKLIPALGVVSLVRRWGWKVGVGVGFLVLLLYLPFLGGGMDLFTSLGIYQRQWVSNPALFAILAPLLGAGGAKAVGYGVLAIVVGWAWRMKFTLEDLFYYGFIALLLFSPTLHPWYLLWLLPLAVLRPRPPYWIWIWSWSIGLSYTAFGLGSPQEEWNMPGWAVAFEYAPVLMAWAAGRISSQ